MRCVPTLLSCALVIALCPSLTLAQTVTGTLQGTIKDAGGGVLPGGRGGRPQCRHRSDPRDGHQRRRLFRAAVLPLGGYEVSASLAGFKTVVREPITVTLNATRVVDFELAPAAVAETITVRAQTPVINTTSGEIKGSLSEREIEDRPTLNPGSFLALAETFTGCGENPTSGQNNPTASSGSSINVNGTGTRGATFQINGVNNDDSSENQNRQGAALSTIKEFQVITNAYSAEFGRGYGAVVLVQTKSGTNQLHGDLYEFRQDSSWNAKSTFSAAKPDNAGKPRLHDNILSRFPNVTPNDPRSARTYQTLQAINQPADDHSLRLDWTPNAVHTLTGRYQWTRQIFESDDVIRGEQARQNNRQAKYRHHLDPRRRPGDRRRVPLRTGTAPHARQHRRRQRHADRPFRRVTGLGLAHRQRRQLPHRSRSDRSPVRL